jgi:prepilin-type N-terminal cleavage/methylation domain-containing protein
MRFGPISREDGFTLIELLIVVALIAIITAVAAGGLMRAKAAANEASALASIRVTSSSQKAYAIACGRGAFAPSYLVLGTPPAIGQGSFISDDLGSAMNPMKAGYRFAMVPGAGSIPGPTDCNGSATVTAFYATAVPLSIASGSRSFAVNANGTMWQTSGGTAPTEPFGPPAQVVK